MRKWLIAVVAVFTLAACAENTAGLRVDGVSQKVLFGDNVLGQRLIIDNIATQPVDDRVRGVVQVTSQYQGDMHIQYRFYWYDDNGLEVNAKPSSWKQTIVGGYETRTLSEVSINPNGTQFRVQIRQVND
jgi:uncharacterized protein YcfL